MAPKGKKPSPGPTPKPLHPDVVGAQQARNVVIALTQQVRPQLARLQAARDMASPAAMRAQATEVDRIRVLLLVNRDLIERGLSHAQEDFALQHALEVAQEQLAEISPRVARAREQADALDRAARGSLRDLPANTLPSSPDETRRRAAAVAPDGLCDDASMQSPESHACPLDVDRRREVRSKVRMQLDSIADNWRFAIIDGKFDKRLEPLLKSNSIHPLLQMLISVGTGWIANAVGSALLNGVQATRNIAAQRNIASDYADAPNLAFVDLDAVTAPEMSKTSQALLKGLGSKLTERVLKAGESLKGVDTIQVLFDGLARVAEGWKEQAGDDVKLLTDPSLVALAEGLSSTDFSVEFFRAKVNSLLKRFDKIDNIGKRSSPYMEPTATAWVVDATGGLRLAMVRKEMQEVEVRVAGGAQEIADEFYMRPTGRFTFEGWVDRSLYPVAHARNPNAMTFTANDARWVTQPAASRDDGDVNMLGAPPPTQVM